MLKCSQVGLPARVGERAQRGSDRASSLLDRERAQRGSDRPCARPMTVSCAVLCCVVRFLVDLLCQLGLPSERSEGAAVRGPQSSRERAQRGSRRPGTHADTDRRSMTTCGSQPASLLSASLERLDAVAMESWRRRRATSLRSLRGRARRGASGQVAEQVSVEACPLCARASRVTVSLRVYRRAPSRRPTCEHMARPAATKPLI